MFGVGPQVPVVACSCSAACACRQQLSDLVKHHSCLLSLSIFPNLLSAISLPLLLFLRTPRLQPSLGRRAAARTRCATRGCLAVWDGFTSPEQHLYGVTHAVCAARHMLRARQRLY